MGERECDDQAEAVWAVVELLGHVKMAGRLTEVERLGAKMGRLDIPQDGGACKKCFGGGEGDGPQMGDKCSDCGGSGRVTTFATQFFGGASVYRITPVTEAVARHVAKGCRPEPVSPWDFPRQIADGPRTGADFYRRGDDDERDDLD